MTRVRQCFSYESISRFLIRTAAAATALVVWYLVAPAYTLPVGPIQRAMLQKESSAVTRRAERDDASAVSGPYVKVEAETMCGDPNPYDEVESALPSVAGVTIHNLQFGINDLVIGGAARGDVAPSREGSAIDAPKGDAAPTTQRGDDPSFHWDQAIKQSALFLAISHAFRFATEPSTRADLKGPFWSDYFHSVKNLRGWGDGDEFLVNYIGHPMEGAVAGYIQIHNDPKAFARR